MSVKYERVPWSSWLPFVHSSYPLKRETELAVVFLKLARETNQSVLFGMSEVVLREVPNNACLRVEGCL